MGRTPTEKLWMGGGAVVALLLLLVGYFLLISPQRGQTAQVQQQTSDEQTQDVVLSTRVAALAAQYKNLPAYERQLQQARLALPGTSGMTAFLRTLQSLGNATSTTVSSLSVGPPAPLGGATAAVPAAPSTGSAPSSSAAGTATGATGTSGVYSIPLSASVTGAVPDLSAFLAALQSAQPRAVLITQITESATSPVATTSAKRSGDEASLALTMQAFVAPTTSASAPAGGSGS